MQDDALRHVRRLLSSVDRSILASASISTGDAEAKCQLLRQMACLAALEPRFLQ